MKVVTILSAPFVGVERDVPFFLHLDNNAPGKKVCIP